MPKKSQAEQAAENAAEEQLKQLLFDADNFGLCMTEDQFRALPDEYRSVMISWVNTRLGGIESVVPPSLVEFASAELRKQLDAKLAEQQQRRVAKFPVHFKKIGWDDLEEGELALKFPIRVDEKYMGDRTAREVFGDKHVQVEMTRRQIGEWDQTEIVDDGRNRIIKFECDITRYSWCDGHYQFLVRCDADMFASEHALEEAATWSGKPGSMRITVLGDYKGPKEEAESEAAVQSRAVPAAEPKKRGRPKKEASAPDKAVEKRPDQPVPVGQAQYNLAMSDKYLVNLKVAKLGDEQYAAEWSGTVPGGGEFTQMEASVRKSPSQAAMASIGNCVDYWIAYSNDPEADTILRTLRHWLKELDLNKSLEAIEAELN